MTITFGKAEGKNEGPKVLLLSEGPGEKRGLGERSSCKGGMTDDNDV